MASGCSRTSPPRGKTVQDALSGAVVSPEARSEPLNVLLCQTHVRRWAIRRPFLGSRRSVESEPPRTPSAIMIYEFLNSVAPMLLAPAYALPAGFPAP